MRVRCSSQLRAPGRFDPLPAVRPAEVGCGIAITLCGHLGTAILAVHQAHDHQVRDSINRWLPNKVTNSLLQYVSDKGDHLTADLCDTARRGKNKDRPLFPSLHMPQCHRAVSTSKIMYIRIAHPTPTTEAHSSQRELLKTQITKRQHDGDNSSTV